MAQVSSRPVALTVAGFDPSGGAGVLADLKTFAAHECYGVAAIAAMTAQNTREVRKVMPVDPEMLRLQLDMLFEDISIAGIKVGLLGGRKNLEIVAACLSAHKELPIVVDPVLRSTSGTQFLPPQDIEPFKRLLFPLVHVLTPNAEEAGRLLGASVSTLEEMKGAAKLLHEQGVRHVVITGGHLDKPTDVYYGGQEMEVFTGHRIESQSTHGTGCTFSSAILTNLIHGKAAMESVVLAKAYVTQAINRAYPIGNGRGPLNHLFRFGEPAAPVRVGGPEPAHDSSQQ
ncbi:MAG TPA: bifunctional hydroxymethylpyrimidine kinase/phosphomethylpyrimidine kinase [Bryobacterales bacterium]|jgi:hydroxymethylpyrimidine/phosphomethylpyrimidine kinase|nr:bifunctional hydroxymethylpyrimidine kinase/phosphomethylpyrimidine kinase [Bryobacterales bacterium]